MGEYVNIRGEMVKLGTCEDLMYCRFDQAQSGVESWSKHPDNAEPRAYLDEKLGWRYRFPFPDEDDIDIGCFEDHDRGVRVTLSDDAWPLLNLADHKTICTRVRPERPPTNRGNERCLHEPVGFNLFLPCPAVHDYADYKTSQWQYLPHIVDIVQQKQVEGNLWTILRCPWCGCRWRVPPEAGFVLANEVATQTGHYPEMFWFGIAHRIRDGYEMALSSIDD